MPEASPDSIARARKIESAVLRRLHAGATQESIASEMRVNPATVSRLVSEHLPKVALLLALVGLKVVDQDARCLRVEYADALLLLAKRHLASVTSSKQLEGDD